MPDIVEWVKKNKVPAAVIGGGGLAVLVAVAGRLGGGGSKAAGIQSPTDYLIPNVLANPVNVQVPYYNPFNPAPSNIPPFQPPTREEDAPQQQQRTPAQVQVATNRDADFRWLIAGTQGADQTSWFNAYGAYNQQNAATATPQAAVPISPTATAEQFRYFIGATSGDEQAKWINAYHDFSSGVSI